MEKYKKVKKKVQVKNAIINIIKVMFFKESITSHG